MSWECTGDTHVQDVLPLIDLVEHTTGEDCVCGPDVEPIQRGDGSTAWLITHHSLDGREVEAARRRA